MSNPKLYRFYATSFGNHGADVGVAEYETTVIDGRTFVDRHSFGLQEVTERERNEYHETREAALRAAASKLTGIASALLNQAEGLREEANGGKA